MYKMESRTFLVIALAVLLHSCSSMSKSLKAFYVHSLSRDNDSLQPRIWKSDYYFYDQNGELAHDKTIHNKADSTVKSISISLGNTGLSNLSFSSSWDQITIVENPSRNNQKMGNPPLDVYLHGAEERKSWLPKDESFSFYYNFHDTVHLFSYSFEHESEGGRLAMNDVTIRYESDTLAYERILEISPEIIDYFRLKTLERGNSIELTTIPTLPDLSKCILKESHFTIIESSDSSFGNIKESYIDSVYVDNVLEVNHSEDFYFLFEDTNSEGRYFYKRYTSSYYREAHYLPNEVSPYYERRYSLAPNGIDTTFESELSVSEDGRLDCYKLVHKGQLTQKSGSNDLRLPIVRREMYFWIDPRKNSIVRKRYLAFTDQDHQLEKEWITSKGYKIITLINSLPEVSGNQHYEIVPPATHEPQYPFYNSLSTKKQKAIGKSYHYHNRKRILNLRKQTTLLEKNRKSGTEKRFNAAASEIYEIYYIR
jgi:hypothetical protein